MIENKIIDLQKERKKKQSRKKTDNKKNTAKKVSQSPRRKKEKRRNIIIIILFVILVFGYSIYTIIGLLIEKSQLKKDNEKLINEKERLEKSIKTIDSPEYIEKKAREELKLVLPGEIIYVDKEER